MKKISFLVLATTCLFACQMSNPSEILNNNNPIEPTKTVFAEKTDALNSAELEITVNSNQLQIINSILESFKGDKQIPESKKNLANYRLEIRLGNSAKENLVIGNLLTKRDPNKVYVGGETESGIDVVYLLDKSDFRVIQRAFPK